MANAIQLVDPSGVVRAWMCGTCFHVGGGVTALGRNADESIVASSKMRAESCCICSRCGQSRPREGRTSFTECADCTEVRYLEADAERAAKALTHDPCAVCDGSGDDWSLVDGGDDCVDCLACNGSGWVAKDGAK